MPEPEELFIDAARHATAAVQGVWQRHQASKRAPAARLADVRPRLELLVEAALGRPWPIRVAQAEAPVPLVRRLFRPERATAVPQAVLPGNDGTAIYLPPELPLPPSRVSPDDYALLAVLQALRCARGSAASMPTNDALAADFFQLAECIAVDAALRRLLPGWGRALDAFAARLVESRRPPAGGGATAELAARYAAFLVGDRAALPVFDTPARSLAWAEAQAKNLHERFPRERCRPWLADFLVGRLFRPEASADAGRSGNRSGSEAAADAETKQVALQRRPRARAAKPGEDDVEPGLWMVHSSEPLQHAEDPFGLNRPEDREAESDLSGGADSLSEMEEARLVQTPGAAREVFYSADAPPRAEAGARALAEPGGFLYPEWDYRSGAYLEQAVRVCASLAPEGPAAWVDQTLARHAGLLAEIRRRLGNLRPARQVLRRQPDGDDIDCDALVAERCERRAGVVPAGAFYLDRRPAPRRLALLLLVDASGSTDAWVADGARVIDVEKEAALVAASALDAARADFSIFAFSGEGPLDVQLQEIKAFGGAWDRAAQQRLAGLEPDRYTRLGGALRHGAALLAQQAADRHLLLLFSDGRPNDCDRYSSRYGLEDARQALIEARLQRLLPYCFTVDREGGAYLPTLFGVGRYTVVQRPHELPLAFVDWLRRAARECQ